MARTLTTDGLKGVLSRTTNQVYLFALKIEHPDLTSPYYLIQNNVDLDIDLPNEGITTFTAYAFDFTLPSVEEDSLPVSEVKIDNVSDFLIGLLRGTDQAPEFSVYVVRSDPRTEKMISIYEDGVFELGVFENPSLLISSPDPSVVEIGALNFTLKSVDWNINTITGQLTLDYDYLNEPCMKFSFTPEISPGLFDYSYEGNGVFIRG